MSERVDKFAANLLAFAHVTDEFRRLATDAWDIELRRFKNEYPNLTNKDMKEILDIFGVDGDNYPTGALRGNRE